MYQYRQALLSMRRGDTDRQIAQTRLLGRPKLAQLRQQALERGWLEPDSPLPDDAVLAEAFGKTRRSASTQSPLEPHRQQITEWMAAGVSGPVILAHLQRSHGYTGSYSSVYRMMVSIAGARPAKATVPLAFGPGEAVQVDFGAGPMLHDPCQRQGAAHLGLCDDPVLLAPPVPGIRLGPEGGHLARMPPPGLRMVRRGAPACDHRQRQVRHHQGLRDRSGRAALLCRMCRELWVSHRPLPAGRSPEERHR